MAKTTNAEYTDAYIASYYIDEEERLIHYLSVVEGECGNTVSCNIETVELTPIMLEQVLEVLHDQHDGEAEPSLEVLHSIYRNHCNFFNELYAH